jgi:class 3 adenylate cyclase
MAMLFAATYPDRTRGLLLFGTVADYDTSSRAAENEAIELDRIERLWGTEEYARLALREWAAPSLADDERLVTWLASYTRRAASPGAAIALERMNEGMDASNILHAIHVPTLAIGRSGDLDFPIEDIRRTAEGIPGASFVELPGQDHFFFVGDTERLLVEIEHFLKEIRDDEAELDRVLATVLFTDIVGSTERAAALGDREWGVLRDSHHARIRSYLGRFRGREVNTAGDGFLATFDGPIRAVRCATSAVAAVRGLGMQIRAGLHTGEVALDGADVRGIAVHIGARVASLAGPSEVLVTSTVKDLVAGAALEFEDRGEHELKGVSRGLAPLPRRCLRPTAACETCESSGDGASLRCRLPTIRARGDRVGARPVVGGPPRRRAEAAHSRRHPQIRADSEEFSDRLSSCTGPPTTRQRSNWPTPPLTP